MNFSASNRVWKSLRLFFFCSPISKQIAVSRATTTLLWGSIKVHFQTWIIQRNDQFSLKQKQLENEKVSSWLLNEGQQFLTVPQVHFFYSNSWGRSHLFKCKCNCRFNSSTDFMASQFPFEIPTKKKCFIISFVFCLQVIFWSTSFHPSVEPTLHQWPKIQPKIGSCPLLL